MLQKLVKVCENFSRVLQVFAAFILFYFTCRPTYGLTAVEKVVVSVKSVKYNQQIYV